jgi:hypothetical protein
MYRAQLRAVVDVESCFKTIIKVFEQNFVRTKVAEPLVQELTIKSVAALRIKNPSWKVEGTLRSATFIYNALAAKPQKGN